MRTTILSILMTYCCLAAGAWAQAPTEVLILPIEMPGYYSPLESETLTKIFQQKVAKLAPQADIQLSTAADLTAYQYKAGANLPPSAEVAEKMCRAYQANYVCWTSVSFRPDFNKSTGSLALGGAARLWVYSQDKRSVVIDQPVSLVRAGHVQDVTDEEASRAVASELAQGCVEDLAVQIVSIARYRQQQPQAQSGVSSWQPPKDFQATQSANYKDMVSAAQLYQRAEKNQSLMNITSSLSDMQMLWTQLTPSERKAINDNYPGITELMQPAPAYGGGYWPYRYR